jgi:hypothetical protein
MRLAMFLSPTALVSSIMRPAHGRRQAVARLRADAARNNAAAGA